MVLLRLYGQPFGGKGSQFNYVRDPAAMVAIGRSYLGLLIAHYTDDGWGVEPEATCHQAHSLWIELNELVGWRLDMDKSPPPERAFKLLGAELLVGIAHPVGRTFPGRAEAIDELIEKHLAQDRLTPAEAASLRGKLAHTRTLQWGRYGAAALRPLQLRQSAPSNVTSLAAWPLLVACLRWWQRLLRQNSARPIPLPTPHTTLHM